MISLTVAEIAAAIGAEAPAGTAEQVVGGSVETDSRLVGAGSIFFALPGEVTDGHLFAEGAVTNGAALVVAERPLDLDVPVLVVDDGVAALAALARNVVARVRARGRLRVVAVTGSNGKTTTKNLMRAIFSAEGPTVAPEGSFNNHVGAPISMLRVDESTAYLVVEMGASGVGEIARLVSIVTPDVGIVLKVGLAHAGEFGGIEQTERAKSEMVRDLPESAVAVLNADDPRVDRMSEVTRARIVRFGHGPESDLRAVDVVSSIEGTSFTLEVDGARLAVQVRILGEHHVSNVLAALAAVLAFVLTGLPAAGDAEPQLWFVAVAAAIAICALVLPGVSGSFLLLAMGLYAPTLDAVNDRDLGYLGVFALGAVLGLASFAPLLQWLLERRRQVTLAIMTGLMLGSLRALWPWQTETGGVLAPEGAQLPMVIALVVAGAALVVGLLFVESRLVRRRIATGRDVLAESTAE